GVQPSLQWGVKPTVPTSHWEHQSSWLTSSANHLVRLEEEGGGNREAERLGGLQVNNKVEFRGPLHGQVGRFGAPQDAIDVIGHPPEQGWLVRPVGQESAFLGKGLQGVDRGRPVR